MGISTKLRALAEERNLSQKQIAAELGIPVSTIGGYFQGTSEPDLDMVKILAGYFDCSVDFLLEYKSRYAKSLEEDELIYIFRGMSAKQREMYLAIGKTLLHFPQDDDTGSPG